MPGSFRRTDNGAAQGGWAGELPPGARRRPAGQTRGDAQAEPSAPRLRRETDFPAHLRRTGRFCARPGRLIPLLCPSASLPRLLPPRLLPPPAPPSRDSAQEASPVGPQPPSRGPVGAAAHCTTRAGGGPLAAPRLDPLASPRLLGRLPAVSGTSPLLSPGGRKARFSSISLHPILLFFFF